MDPADQYSETASWRLIGVMAATSLLLCLTGGFYLMPGRAILPLGGVMILAGAMIVGHVRKRPRLRVGATAFLQMTLFTILGVTSAYALAARAGPLWDDRFAAADTALGFDWPRVFAAADRAPVWLWVGGIAYHSLPAQMIVCIVVLSATCRRDTLRIAVAANIIAGCVTIAISGAMPALGNLFDPADYDRLWPSVAWLERDMILGLRDGSWRALDLTQLMGIVSFPSYHAAMPVILAWAQRELPGWRVLASIWSGVTIIATPTFGGHYGIDVVAGLAIAPLALAAAARLARAHGSVARSGAQNRGATGEGCGCNDPLVTRRCA